MNANNQEGGQLPNKKQTKINHSQYSSNDMGVGGIQMIK